MRPILTDELLDYIGELYLENKGLVSMAFHQFIERWMESKEGWLKSV